MKECIRAAVLLGIGVFVLMGSGHAALLQWDEMPPLPDAEGVAGAFVGAHNDALIVAGGANFPNAPRWVMTGRPTARRC